MARSIQKSGVAVRSEIYVTDGAGTGVTGLVNGDFTKLLAKNGANSVIAVTVTEIANGRYTVTWTPDSVGEWYLIVTNATYNPYGWQESYDVTAEGVDTDYYQMKVVLFDDDTGTADRYVVAFFKNTQPVTSGITSPTIQVVKAADGTDLIASTALTQIGATGRYRYNAAGGERITDGAAYYAAVGATIDGAARTWSQPVGRDS